MAEAPSRAIMLFGTDEPAAETRLLKAGPLSAELDAGNLRYIRHEGREAIRAISYVVRDRFWGTFNPEIRDLEIEESADRFVVAYSASCTGDGQRFDYRARITGNADGTLRFEGIGSPVTDFLTNRTGFVVLHGVEGISGHPVKVSEVSGRAVESRFPEIIDPEQPIMNIRALTHEVAPGLEVVCTMQGDTFEMEDQRNWTDASYKTYVRPLGLPHPFTLKAGEGIEQAVELRFEGAAPAPSGGGRDADAGGIGLGGRAGGPGAADRHGARVALDRSGRGPRRGVRRASPRLPELLLRCPPRGPAGHAGVQGGGGRARLPARAGSGGARPGQPRGSAARYRRHGERRRSPVRLGRAESGRRPGLRHAGERVRRHVALRPALMRRRAKRFREAPSAAATSCTSPSSTASRPRPEGWTS